MEKRKLSALPRPEATAEMVEMADRLDGMEHIVTAELVDDNKILLLNFYEVSKLKKGKTEAAFRTFLSSDDYITQDLSQSKVKWLTAAFDNMQGFRLWEYKWDQKHGKANTFQRCLSGQQRTRASWRAFSRLTAKTLTRTYGMLLTDSRTRSRQNDWKRNTEKSLHRLICGWSR